MKVNHRVSASVEEGKAVTDLGKLPGDLSMSIEEGAVVTDF